MTRTPRLQVAVQWPREITQTALVALLVLLALLALLAGGIGWYRLVSAGIGLYRSGIGLYRFVSVWYRFVSVDIGLYRSGIGLYRVVSVRYRFVSAQTLFFIKPALFGFKLAITGLNWL